MIKIWKHKKIMLSKNTLTATVIIAILIAGCSSQKQEGFKVEANIEGIDRDEVIMRYKTGDSRVADTAKVTGGQVVFTGRVDYPNRAAISISKNEWLPFYLENSEITIRASADSVDNAKVTGSESHTLYENFKERQTALREQYHDTFEKMQKVREQDNSARQKELRAKLDSLSEERGKLKEEFVRNNPDSFVGLNIIRRMTMNNSYEELSSLYTELSDELKNSQLGQQIGTLIEAKKRTQIGTKAPGFTLPNMEGDAVSLSDYRGQYVLVDFWASWCKPCRAEHPHYVDAYEKYKDDNFTILSVSVDKNKEDWKKAVKEDGLTWTQLCTPEGEGMNKSEVAQQYGIQSIPANFLLNPEGEIVAKELRGEMLEKKLKKTL